MKLRVLLRLLEIQRVLLRHGLDGYVRATHLYRPLRFVFFLSPGIWLGVSRKNRLQTEKNRILNTIQMPVCCRFEKDRL